MKIVKLGWITILSVALILLWANAVSAQTFSSGSTGTAGAFVPAANTTLTLPPSGIFNFTTINIPSGVTVTFTGNSANTPVTLLATGNVTIAGTVSVNGSAGIAGATTGPPVNPGGAGGPGGFAGGQGGSRGTTNNGGAAGFGPGGGTPAPAGGAVAPGGGSYGAPTSFVTLLPLFGGSGGGGSFGGSTLSGSSGGGGGGAVVIASSTQITVTGAITANGGDGGGVTVSAALSGGGGSGGAIRLVAPQITGTGLLQAVGGSLTVFPGASGRIRLEAFALGFTGTSNPAASQSTTPGPVTSASTPALINLPTLTINAVAGVASPPTPTGSYTTADVALPPGTVNPVTVTLAANNTPLGTVFTVKLIPQFASPTTVNSTPSTGTFSTSTASANLTLPSGQVSVLTAFANFTLPAQVAGLFPFIDGEPVERIMVVVAYGEPSTVSLVTRSGKTVPVDRLPLEEQRRVAFAWEVLHTSH